MERFIIFAVVTTVPSSFVHMAPHLWMWGKQKVLADIHETVRTPWVLKKINIKNRDKEIFSSADTQVRVTWHGNELVILFHASHNSDLIGPDNRSLKWPVPDLFLNFGVLDTSAAIAVVSILQLLPGCLLSTCWLYHSPWL